MEIGGTMNNKYDNQQLEKTLITALSKRKVKILKPYNGILIEYKGNKVALYCKSSNLLCETKLEGKMFHLPRKAREELHEQIASDIENGLYSLAMIVCSEDNRLDRPSMLDIGVMSEKGYTSYNLVAIPSDGLIDYMLYSTYHIEMDEYMDKLFGLLDELLEGGVINLNLHPDEYGLPF